MATSEALSALVAALAGLREALPVDAKIFVSRGHVHLSPETDDGVHVLAELLGVPVRAARHEDHRWFDCGKEVDRVYVAISGPHHRVDAAINEGATAAAVEAANAAIARASS